MNNTLNQLSAASVSLGGEDQIPERNPRELLANAVRVAAMDVPIANAIRSDDQRKAVFAKMSAGGGGGGGKGGSRPAMNATVQVPSTGGSAHSWSFAAPGLAEAQTQNAQWIGSQLAAGRTVVTAGGGQITADGTWTPQGGFVPHSPEVLQAMATTRAQIAFNKQLEQQMFERASAGFNHEMAGAGGTRPALDVMPRDPGGMVYPGGSPNFDERTGRYIDQPEPRYTTMPIRQPSGGQYNRPLKSTSTEIPGSSAYLARMNTGTPAGNYYKQLADSGVQWASPAQRSASAKSGRSTTKPTPTKPGMAAILEKMKPVQSRPIKTSNSLARALERYE